MVAAVERFAFGTQGQKQGANRKAKKEPGGY